MAWSTIYVFRAILFLEVKNLIAKQTKSCNSINIAHCAGENICTIKSEIFLEYKALQIKLKATVSPFHHQETATPIWKPRLALELPKIPLSRWRIFETEDGNQHFLLAWTCLTRRGASAPR